MPSHCGTLAVEMESTPLPDFETLVSGPDEALDLARIALAIAADTYPGLDACACLARFDEMAEAIADAADISMPLAQRLAILDRHLFEVEGFRGNGKDYYDPRNSYLNEVLDRRTGIPITLSLVYLEVGWRLGLPLAPVSFPNHFLVACTGSGRVFIDPFNRGARSTSDKLLERLVPILGSVRRAREYLPRAAATASRRKVVARLLRNLKQIHAYRRDLDRLLAVSNRMVALDPEDATARRDRGHVFADLECHQAAYHDYIHYLRLAPLAGDAADIRARVERLRPIALRLN